MAGMTIKDIAKKCHVGVSTVSRAMNNHPDINPETKEKILKAIEEANYCALIKEAITDMIQCGHQKIGCIYGVSDAYTSIQRTNGYKEGLLANKIKVDETIIRCGQSTLEGGYRETNWLLENAELDAIFVENNLMTLGCVKALSERGVEIPNQIALLGYDDDDWRDTVVIPISSIQPPRYEMGEKATQLLLQKINYPKRRSITIKLSPELIKRKSY